MVGRWWGACALAGLLLALSACGGTLLMLFESGAPKGDMLTCFTASITTLSNVGPGLNYVGATYNYAEFSDASKWVMSLLMVLGRIEVYAVFALFVPQFWRAY